MAGKRVKVEFPGSQGMLAGLLESPDAGVQNYALFAHCFTCGKDIAAASRIARALVARGYAVLRFDFTGLGSSDGEFANTNFSSNVDDLVAAANFLREHYLAPSLLIGHSLGGAAVLKAAHQVPECTAIVTIGAPSDARHVAKQFACDLETIETKGEAQVNLAGRTFTIKKQFLDDIGQQHFDDIARLRKALLIMHSPLDQVVGIGEAEKIYQQAKHPKSFISLDDADHLLTNPKDAEYVAATIAAWASRFLAEREGLIHETSGVTSGEVVVDEHNHQFTRRVYSDTHFWLADEPQAVGGDNLGPDPYEHLLAALGTCTSMTIRMYANRKGIPLEDVRVQLNHQRIHSKDCADCEQVNGHIDILDRRITLKGDLTDEQRQRLMEIANKCPVHKTLTGKIEITTSAV